MQVKNDDNHKKLLPKWMNIIQNKSNENNERFKSVEFFPLGKKDKKMMILVDKNINLKTKLNRYNPNRSIFSFQDFRHGVMTEKDKIYYDSLVSQEPKKFFDWDDGKEFNPKYKKDI